MKKWFCRVKWNDWGGVVRIYLGYKDGDEVYIIRNNVAEKIDPMETQTEATLQFTAEVQEDTSILTHLVDGLIECGIKPTVKVPDSNEMTAVKYHLEDMRKIVFEERTE